MNLLDNDKINFIMGEHHQFSKKRSRGGHMMMHLLSYKLAKKGHNVYIFANPMYPHENIRVIPQTYWEDPSPDSNIATWTYESFNYPLHKTVSVYPCDYPGNPFGTLHNARWILDNIDPDIENSWSNEDVYFLEGHGNGGRWKTQRRKEKILLSVVDYRFDEFYDEKIKRKGFCYLPHKYTPENFQEIISPFNPSVIDRFQNGDNSFGGHDHLRKVFSSHEYMLTFDNKSYLPVAAALCGCKAIILRSPLSGDSYKKLTPVEYRLENPQAMFGIAYGIEDIGWANQTIGFVKEYQEELQKIDEKTVDRFIEFWKERLNM